MDQVLYILDLQKQYEEQEQTFKKLKESINHEMILQQQCTHKCLKMEKGKVVEKNMIEINYSIAILKYCSICKLRL